MEKKTLSSRSFVLKKGKVYTFGKNLKIKVVRIGNKRCDLGIESQDKVDRILNRR